MSDYTVDELEAEIRRRFEAGDTDVKLGLILDLLLTHMKGATQ